MGRVAVTYRIMPEGTEVDVGALESAVRKALGATVRAIAVRPVAFGLKALEATVVVDDAGGQAERVEEQIRGLAGVGEVETLGATLL